MKNLFLVIAVIFLALAAFGVTLFSAVSIGWLGLTMFAASFLPLE